MKRAGIQGLALCAVLAALGLSGCDANLASSNTGDSALSKPRGELTITGVAEPGNFAKVYVAHNYQSSTEEASASFLGNNVTVTLTKNGSPWSETGDFYVALIGTRAGKPEDDDPDARKTGRLWVTSSTYFDKGRATVDFSGAVFIDDDN